MRILIALIDDVDRQTVADAFATDDHEVLTVTDGREAITTIDRERPDLVIVDLGTPGMGGDEVAGWVKDHVELSSTPVIVRVDADTFADPGRLIACGADDFVRAESDVTELLARVRLRAGRGSVSRLLQEAGFSRLRMQEAVDDFLQRHRDREEEMLGLFVTDPETGLNNRASFKVKLDEELKRAERYGVPLSALLIKLSGDVRPMTLKEIAGLLLLQSRDLDIIGRYGHSDFSLLLPNTPQEGAVLLARRISEAIITHPFDQNTGGVDFQLRVGVAAYPADGLREARELMNRANAAMVKAEDFGDKAICIWEHGAGVA